MDRFWNDDTRSGKTTMKNYANEPIKEIKRILGIKEKIESE